MEKISLKYRTWYNGKPPRQTHMQIPGWSGQPNNHTDGDVPQPWHCTPFLEGSTYGLELLYAFDTECHVKMVNGELQFLGDFEKEKSKVPSENAIPPFKTFAPGHFGMTSCLDILVPDGYVLRLEPHPRYFTDETYTVPLLVPGHINSPMWPKIFFVVFKNPMPGQTYIFRKDEPYGQILVVPRKVLYDIQPMTHSEQLARAAIDDIIVKYSKTICSNNWRDNLGNNFNDKYKMLNQLYVRKGKDAVINFLQSLSSKTIQKHDKIIKKKLFFPKRKDSP